MKSGTKNGNFLNQFVKIGLLCAFISLVIFSSFLYKNLKVRNKSFSKNLDSGVLPPTTTQVLTNTNQWEKYINKDFGFSLLYPGLLVRRETKDSEDYLFFVRFEENTFSSGSNQKGVAVGVSTRGLGEEAVRIKKEMMKLGGELVEESETTLVNIEAVRLDFEPKDPTINEERSVVVVFKNGKSFSISTVPIQIDKVLEGFKFL